MELTDEGAWIYVERTKDQIIIRQDYIGSYGLYLYEKDGWWAISNSFLYLVEDIWREHVITFNKAYSDHFLCSGLCTMSYEETMVSEIRLLDRSAVVRILVQEGTLETTLTDYRENTVSPDSKEGMALLDEWFAKWTGIIRGLSASIDVIETDLSGGFDSRVVLALFLCSGIDMGRVCVHSNEGSLHTFEEDFRIATQICGHYHFALNSGMPSARETVNLTARDIINISFYLKLGFHKQMHYTCAGQKEYRYAFTGSGGGLIRDLQAAMHWTDENAMLETRLCSGRNYGDRVAQSSKDILSRSFDAIRRKYESFGRRISAEDMPAVFYRETRNRHHFGKELVESLFTGRITFCPLLDSSLQRLRLQTEDHRDSNLLVALIFERYMPELASFPFEGGRSIDDATLHYARVLNGRYPRQEPASVSGKWKMPSGAKRLSWRTNQNPPVDREEIVSIIRDAFYSPETMCTFEMRYSERSFRRLAGRWETEAYYPDSNAYVVLAISNILRDCRASERAACRTHAADEVIRQAVQDADACRRGNPFCHPSCLSYYVTARIDIKNAGSDGNDLVFLNPFEDDTQVRTPAWFGENGKGYQLHSDRGTLTLRIRCIGDGTLQIALRGLDVKDNTGRRIPFWIDYHLLEINGERILDGTVPAWHDHPFRYARTVENQEILSIVLSWEAHDERREPLMSANPAASGKKEENGKAGEIRTRQTRGQQPGRHPSFRIGKVLTHLMRRAGDRAGSGRE